MKKIIIVIYILLTSYLFPDTSYIIHKIAYYSRIHQIEFELCQSVCFKESSYRQYALNRNNSDNYYSRGLFMLNEKYYPKWKRESFYNIDININEGIRVLKDCLTLAHNDCQLALIYYNFGFGNMKKGKPIPESTIDYVNQVLFLRKYLRVINGKYDIIEK